VVDEVSARVLHFYVEVARGRGVPREQLFEGVPQVDAVWAGSRRWYDWAAHIQLLDRFEHLLGGPQAAEESARGAYGAHVSAPLRALVAFWGDPRFLYRAGFTWFATWLYRHVRFDYSENPDGSITARLTLPDRYPPSAAFFRMWRGTLRSAPGLLGFCDSDVTSTFESHRAEFVIRVPPTPTGMRSRFRAALRSATGLDPLLGELRRHDEELRGAYEALVRSRQAFLDVSEATPNAVILHRGGSVVYANPAATALFGVPNGESLGKDPLVLRVPMAERAMFETWLNSESPTPLELALERPGGERRLAVLQPGRRVSFDGEPAQLLVAQDVTHARKLEEELRFHERLATLGRLSASIAHELNSPLTYVRGNLELLASRLAGAETAGMARAALDGAERMAAILGQLRPFYAPSPDAAEEADLAEVLDKSLALAHRALVGARVVREWGAAPRVRASPNRLSQVFVNLLTNAGQALHWAGRVRADAQVTVRLGTDAQGLAVAEVEDNGPGLSPKAREHLFEPFFTTKPEGTGLGLSICHRIVGDLGGQITTEPTLGGGACFRVTLPGSQRGAVSRAEQTPRSLRASLGGRPRVLVVDDHPRLVTTTRFLLDECDVEGATSAEEAMAKLGAQAFDAVLCDVRLGERSGIEVYRALEALRPDAGRSVVFMTGGLLEGDERAVLSQLPNPCLEKPFSAEALKAALATVLHPRAELRGN
jgi:signal transduction histidine kinase/CheY-like chemotaxis protein